MRWKSIQLHCITKRILFFSWFSSKNKHPMSQIYLMISSEGGIIHKPIKDNFYLHNIGGAPGPSQKARHLSMYIYSPHCLSSKREREGVILWCFGEMLESTWPRGNDVRILVKTKKREIVVACLIISYNMVSLVLQMDGVGRSIIYYE